MKLSLLSDVAKGIARDAIRGTIKRVTDFVSPEAEKKTPANEDLTFVATMPDQVRKFADLFGLLDGVHTVAKMEIHLQTGDGKPIVIDVQRLSGVAVLAGRRGITFAEADAIVADREASARASRQAAVSRNEAERQELVARNSGRGATPTFRGASKRQKEPTRFNVDERQDDERECRFCGKPKAEPHESHCPRAVGSARPLGASTVSSSDATAWDTIEADVDAILQLPEPAPDERKKRYQALDKLRMTVEARGRFEADNGGVKAETNVCYDRLNVALAAVEAQLRADRAAAKAAEEQRNREAIARVANVPISLEGLGGGAAPVPAETAEEQRARISKVLEDYDLERERQTHAPVASESPAVPAPASLTADEEFASAPSLVSTLRSFADSGNAWAQAALQRVVARGGKMTAGEIEVIAELMSEGPSEGFHEAPTSGPTSDASTPPVATVATRTAILPADMTTIATADASGAVPEDARLRLILARDEGVTAEVEEAMIAFQKEPRTVAEAALACQRYRTSGRLYDAHNKLVARCNEHGAVTMVGAAK